ncbi:hypothetical protein [Roseicyclus sp.]|uniref:hypothetical protein n=1 Tax=Roseicyclus sp. TaxID=1914329 RepID=UPI003F9F491A
MTRPLATACLAAGLALAAGPAAAQSALERLEVLDERMNEVVLGALEAQIPALAGYLPSVEWDEPMRANAACLLAEVETRAGAAGVERLLESYAETTEAATGTADLSSLQLETPEGMTPAEFQAAYAECGMRDWLYGRLEASGALAIIMESAR